MCELTRQESGDVNYAECVVPNIQWYWGSEPREKETLLHDAPSETQKAEVPQNQACMAVRALHLLFSQHSISLKE